MAVVVQVSFPMQVFGGTYQRPGVELRDRQMLNMAALAAAFGE